MNFIASIIALIRDIPATFWGVLVGSFFSLGGVAVSNRENLKRLREQFENDRKLRTEEREMALRRDIYLAAAEAIDAGINSLSRFTNLDVPNDKVTISFDERSAAIAKVNVVANEQTLIAVAQLTDELHGAFSRLFAIRVPLIIQKEEVAQLGKFIEASIAENARWIELMKQHNLAGDNDQRKWSVIEKNFKFEQERQTDLTKKQQELILTLRLKNLDLTKNCLSELAAVRRLVSPALLAVREELRLPLDQKKFQSLIETSIERQQADIADLMRKLSDSIH